MKLTYIYHSCFAIESDDLTIIIDYYKDSDNNPQNGIIHSELLNKKGKLYVLSSHSHPDHFNKEILEWKKIKENITYIFSKDIWENGLVKPSDAIYLNKLETYRDHTLEIKAFGSTDIGISFLIRVNGKTIFHAGDLNNWHWNEESTQEEIDEAEAYYQNELNLLADNVKHINLAMFPIDPRLGKDYMKGAIQFIDAIKTDIIVPMHFDNAYDKIATFAPIATEKGVIYIPWAHKGECIDF